MLIRPGQCARTPQQQQVYGASESHGHRHPHVHRCVRTPQQQQTAPPATGIVYYLSLLVVVAGGSEWHSDSESEFIFATIEADASGFVALSFKWLCCLNSHWHWQADFPTAPSCRAHGTQV